MWKLFNEVFDCLPFSAIVEEKILCVHAGLSPELQSLEQLRRIPRPTEIPDAICCATCCGLIRRSLAFVAGVRVIAA